MTEELKEVVQGFSFEGEPESIQPLGIGNINASYTVKCSGGKNYTLQQLNTEIFTMPDKVMENIVRVTDHLKEKILAEKGDPERETLNFIPAKSGGYMYRYGDKNVYRAYRYIDDVTTVQSSENTDIAYKVAYSFGVFQRRLSDFDARALHETIPDFHNTPARLKVFEDIVKKDPCNRAKEVEDLIAFSEKEAYLADQITGALRDGSMPVRVTHNDTKINNILFDNKSGEGICVIDLDTVMPGSALYDFGDMVRSGANATEEDDTDLSRVKLDMNYYEAFVKGFMDGVGNGLTKQELAGLAMSAKVLTYELCLRFLGDYINGDVYFKIRRPKHNLERAANQFKLLEDMENKYEQMVMLSSQG